jgi:hypothetical protein
VATRDTGPFEAAGVAVINPAGLNAQGRNAAQGFMRHR